MIAALLDADPKIGESASWAIKYCAPDSIDDLVECLHHERAQVRERAAHALGNIGDLCRAAAAPVLRALLHDEDAAVRKRAAWALGLVHDPSADTVRTLTQVPAHGTAGDVAAALHALGNIGKAAGPASLAAHKPMILAGLERPEADARRWALYAAESVGLEAQAWALLLVDLVRREGSSEIRCVALECRRSAAISCRAMMDTCEWTPSPSPGCSAVSAKVKFQSRPVAHFEFGHWQQWVRQ